MFAEFLSLVLLVSQQYLSRVCASGLIFKHQRGTGRYFERVIVFLAILTLTRWDFVYSVLLSQATKLRSAQIQIFPKIPLSNTYSLRNLRTGRTCKPGRGHIMTAKSKCNQVSGFLARPFENDPYSECLLSNWRKPHVWLFAPFQTWSYLAAFPLRF